MENKIKLSKALVVNKEEITKLQESQMSKIKGGFGKAPGGGVSCADLSCAASCSSGSCNGGGAGAGGGF
jgi:hypothetical protein